MVKFPRVIVVFKLQFLFYNTVIWFFFFLLITFDNFDNTLVGLNYFNARFHCQIIFGTEAKPLNFRVFTIGQSTPLKYLLLKLRLLSSLFTLLCIRRLGQFNKLKKKNKMTSP